MREATANADLQDYKTTPIRQEIPRANVQLDLCALLCHPKCVLQDDRRTSVCPACSKAGQRMQISLRQ